MKYKSVAIDGPSGAGKSTLAKRLAKELGFIYVDTGAIYRTLGLFALSRGVSPSDEEQVKELLPSVSIYMDYGPDGLQHMYLGGKPELGGVDVTDRIRTPEVSDAASKVSALPMVRDFLMDMQRGMAQNYSVVMDGRDIGTVVLPHAEVKIFLTASPEERARRRCAELQERGTSIAYETVLSDIMERDARDSGRSAAPLKQAEDAILVDTTGISLEESFQLLLQTVRENLA